MKEKILNYIKDEVSIETFEEIDLHEDLLGSGIVDSMGMMKLIDFIEKELNMSIPSEDMTVKNFMTVERIMMYLKK
jgi:acyl carrier protein